MPSDHRDHFFRSDQFNNDAPFDLRQDLCDQIFVPYWTIRKDEQNVFSLRQPQRPNKYVQQRSVGEITRYGKQRKGQNER